MRNASTNASLTTWHAGEKAIQRSVGLADRMDEIGRHVIRDFMPDQHRAFFAQLPFVVTGSVDHRGDAWSTLLVGTPGFLSSPTPKMLDIRAARDPRDPASEGMAAGDAIGLLGIELHSRRRNRMNGTVSTADGGALHVEVEQSFGNCPKYIHLRDYAFLRDPGVLSQGEVREAGELDQAARSMIETADTFFVASYADRDGHRQVDVSHRGGEAGFVTVASDGTLTIPDYSGNFFFSTLGNILLNGQAGLVFVNFETGDVLQLTGDAELILDSSEIETFEGTQRLWKFHPRRVVRRAEALALRWSRFSRQ
jgi:hypothetical protein